MELQFFDTIVSSGLFDKIKEEDRPAAYRQLEITSKKYKKNEIVFLEGDRIEKVCIVVRGTVWGEKAHSNGDVHIESVIEKDAVFALEIAISKKKTSTLNYICSEDTEIIFLAMRSIENNVFSVEIKKIFGYKLCDANIRMSYMIAILTKRGLRDRIFTYLRIREEKQGGSPFVVPLSREQLAKFLSVNRSALSNELSKMKQDGLIDFHGNEFMILK